jgi:LysM repeat protein
MAGWSDATRLDADVIRVFHSGMRKISLLILSVAFPLATVFGQDTATQQQLDKLSGTLQDIQEAQAQQGRRLDALEKEFADLHDKVSAPAADSSASADDLKKLAEQVQEIDKKRQDDRDLILKEIEKLGKISAAPIHRPAPNAAPAASGDNTPPVPAGPQKGHPYQIQAGDTLGAIAKAYREQGVKVTTKDILRANPGLDPGKLFVGQKIFVPDPAL